MSEDLKDRVIKAFSEIESRINYSNIHAYMILANLEWCVGGKMKIPSKQELRTAVFDLFDLLMENFEFNKSSIVQGGGFYINYCFWDDNNIKIEILFSIQKSYCLFGNKSITL